MLKQHRKINDWMLTKSAQCQKKSSRPILKTLTGTGIERLREVVKMNGKYSTFQR
jgi:hypothetical protein